MPDSPFNSFLAVTLSDTVDIPKINDRYPDAIFVGGAGNAVIVTQVGGTVTLNGLLAGHIYPISPKRVNSSSTTAANLVALWRV